jgi:predicted ester cyclase
MDRITRRDALLGGSAPSLALVGGAANAEGATPRALVERLYAASNAGEWDALLDLYAPTFLRNGEPLAAREWRARNVAFYAAFPDARHELHDVAVTGDCVYNRFVSRQTHTGTFEHPSGAVIPPTGRRIEIWGLELRRVKDGRFSELWVPPDFAAEVLRQLGVGTRVAPLES